LYYLFIINFIAFILMYIDKQKAKKHKWRISEATLIGSSVIGGSIGMLLGMHYFRHKTKHKKFTILGPAILILQIGIALYFI
jgi:uncharacterized membrane protein YsdA (DUF1294 family)